MIRYPLLIGLFILPAIALGQEFTPLTNLPGLSNTMGADSLPDFFNNLYRLCIGAAAVIAILQIMRAGVYFMFNKGSVAQNEKAKGLITNSILGLLLVLSPYIVFGIINPDILDLKLDVDAIGITGVTEEDLTRDEELACSPYIDAHPVRSDDLSNRCNTGERPVEARCCPTNPGLSIGVNAICCARVASTQFLLEYTYDRTANNGSVCSLRKADYFATYGSQGTLVPGGNSNGSPGCDASVVAQQFNRPPYSNFQITQSCVAVSERSVPAGEYVISCTEPTAQP